MKQPDYDRIADFLYELGTMRKLMRMHRQLLMTDDMSDNIASHSYRVAMIGWTLARAEDVDAHKVVLMCLVHDIEEIRTSDHNWLHKRYVGVDEDKVIEEQLGTLPFTELEDVAKEYNERTSKESIVAKDADLLDQILLLLEYSWQGNREAQVWLKGKTSIGGNAQEKALQTESARKIAATIQKRDPGEWWKDLWTPKNKK